MADGTTFRITGGRELDRALRRLDAKIERKVGRQALRKGAKVLQKEVAATAPRSNIIDKQHLQDSIKVSRPRNQRHNLVIRIGVSGLARLYAHIVEFGNSENPARPYWRPAFARKAGEMISVVAEKLGQDIIEEVRRGN